MGGGYLQWDVLNIEFSAFIEGRKKGQIICRCIITAHNSNTCVATCNSQQQLHSTFPHTHTHAHTHTHTHTRAHTHTHTHTHRVHPHIALAMYVQLVDENL